MVTYRDEEEEEEPAESIDTKKFITYREEEEPDESIQRGWLLTEKKRNLMTLYKEVGCLQRRRGT